MVAIETNAGIDVFNLTAKEISLICGKNGVFCYWSKRFPADILRAARTFARTINKGAQAMKAELADFLFYDGEDTFEQRTVFDCIQTQAVLNAMQNETCPETMRGIIKLAIHDREFARDYLTPAGAIGCKWRTINDE